jgi:hypothetical protein
MKKSRKRGPVPMPPQETRRNLVQSKVTDAELKRVHAAKGRATVSTWLRGLILAATEDPSPIKTKGSKKTSK